MAVWLNTVFHGFDYSILSFYNVLAKSAGDFLTPLMIFISFFGKGGIMMIVLGVILLLFKKTRKCGVTALIGILIGYILVNLTIKPLVDRERPFVYDEYRPFWEIVGMTSGGGKSFPSGHTNVVACALAGIFFASKNKKVTWTLFIPVLLMGISRNYLIVHYPTDVIAGGLVGTLSAFLGHLLVNFLYKKMNEHLTNKVCNFILNASIVDLFVKKPKDTEN